MPSSIQKRAVGAALIACACLTAVPAAAQHGRNPDDLGAARDARFGVMALGKQWNAEVAAKTAELYAAAHREIDSSGIKRTSAVSYGPHPQQTLDLYVPDGGFSEPSVVLVYLHGGGLSGGDKDVAGTDGLIYGNVARFIARAGGIGINANYRLVPDAKWPSGAEDVRLILEWVRANVAPYGGDPSNVVLIGNSAGATHIATYLFHEPSQLEGGAGITGAVLSSGAFDLGDSDAARAYFGRNGARRTPLALVDAYDGPATPILLWSAELDPASIETGVAEMYMKLCRKYRDCPPFAQLQNHNHVSHVMSIDTADRDAVNVMIDFYHRARDGL